MFIRLFAWLNFLPVVSYILWLWLSHLDKNVQVGHRELWRTDFKFCVCYAMLTWRNVTVTVTVNLSSWLLLLDHIFCYLVECAAGYFGKDCSEPCDCVNGAGCNHRKGHCICQPGWKGKRCDKGWAQIALVLLQAN